MEPKFTSPKLWFSLGDMLYKRCDKCDKIKPETEYRNIIEKDYKVAVR